MLVNSINYKNNFIQKRLKKIYNKWNKAEIFTSFNNLKIISY